MILLIFECFDVEVVLGMLVVDFSDWMDGDDLYVVVVLLFDLNGCYVIFDLVWVMYLFGF